MRTLLTALVAVVLGASAFTGVTVVNGLTTSTAPDTTMSRPQYVTAPTGYPDCGHWGQRYGVIVFSGVRTLAYAGCVNPVRPGDGDSFAGRLAGYLSDASHQ